MKTFQPKIMSIKSRSLRPQLFIAFCLMSVIPILVLLNFIFPSIFVQMDKGLITGIVIVLSLFGFVVIKRIVDSIIFLNTEVRNIAGGELSHSIPVSREDEIGELSQALNQLTHHIRDNMDELKIYGERTKDINVKINKQVVALNGVLQIGNLVSAKTALKDIFDATVARLVQVADATCAFVILKEGSRLEVVAHSGLSGDCVVAAKSPANEYILTPFVSAQGIVKLEIQDLPTQKGGLLKLFNAKNALVHPLAIHGEPQGFLGIATSADNVSYGQDDADLLDVFAKQLIIAIENDYLAKKVEDLEIKDSLTDLYNKRYMLTRLDEEILRAISHQQPCSFILLQIRDLKGLAEKSGELAVEGLLRRAAEVLKTNVREFDRVGRMEFDMFGLVLPETNKKQAQEFSQQIKARVVSALTVSGVIDKEQVIVSCAENPIDGADSAILMEKARASL